MVGARGSGDPCRSSAALPGDDLGLKGHLLNLVRRARGDQHPFVPIRTPIFSAMPPRSAGVDADEQDHPEAVQVEFPAAQDADVNAFSRDRGEPHGKRITFGSRGRRDAHQRDAQVRSAPGRERGMGTTPTLRARSVSADKTVVEGREREGQADALAPAVNQVSTSEPPPRQSRPAERAPAHEERPSKRVVEPVERAPALATETNGPLISSSRPAGRRAGSVEITKANPAAPAVAAAVSSEQPHRPEDATGEPGQRATTSDDAPIRITIGRIEVQAQVPTTSNLAAPARTAPRLSLDEYLRRRNRAARP